MKNGSSKGGEVRVFWGQSHASYDAAVMAAVETARAALGDKNLEWFEVIEFRGGIIDEKVQFQTAVRIGYH